ncbi:MAG: hypothetical protein A2252_00980 [Elusimicrobia bacterium RIFOXYA2_FULL_39_19]|nr:MAG: hypothetical protein A2252_00980 [Elusimicrobia bacterium RIFOXYA2_FULL_39_19]
MKKHIFLLILALFITGTLQAQHKKQQTKEQNTVNAVKYIASNKDTSVEDRIKMLLILDVSTKKEKKALVAAIKRMGKDAAVCLLKIIGENDNKSIQTIDSLFATRAMAVLGDMKYVNALPVLEITTEEALARPSLESAYIAENALKAILRIDLMGSADLLDRLLDPETNKNSIFRFKVAQQLEEFPSRISREALTKALKRPDPDEKIFLRIDESLTKIDKKYAKSKERKKFLEEKKQFNENIRNLLEKSRQMLQK